jgi:hypothetical protein
LNIVSAWASEQSVVLGQVKTDEKSNEITAIPELLKILELEGCIVTIDAIGCQTQIVKEIAAVGRRRDGHRLLPPKADHLPPFGPPQPLPRVFRIAVTGLVRLGAGPRRRG